MKEKRGNRLGARIFREDVKFDKRSAEIFEVSFDEAYSCGNQVVPWLAFAVETHTKKISELPVLCAKLIFGVSFGLDEAFVEKLVQVTVHGDACETPFLILRKPTHLPLVNLLDAQYAHCDELSVHLRHIETFLSLAYSFVNLSQLAASLKWPIPSHRRVRISLTVSTRLLRMGIGSFGKLCKLRSKYIASPASRYDLGR